MPNLNRREALRSLAGTGIASACRFGSQVQDRPNVILCMADDQGWGDTGYNGHPFLKTPQLDLMSESGLRFDRFYSGAPVCAPTRGSALTGRHPFRYGIWSANAGRMLDEELTLAEMLQGEGYVTGHFGKWHLGTLTNDELDGRRGGRKPEYFAPPWEHGFDEVVLRGSADADLGPNEEPSVPFQVLDRARPVRDQQLGGRRLARNHGQGSPIHPESGGERQAVLGRDLVPRTPQPRARWPGTPCSVRGS